MMVLGLETSAHLNSVALAEGDRILGEFSWDGKGPAAAGLRRIISVIDVVLSGRGLALGDVGGLGVGIGPGSWTGVRIGVTVAKTLALATGKPLCGVTSLEALAHQGRHASALLCPIIDGGRGSGIVYAALYRSQGGVLCREGDYYMGGIDKLLRGIGEPCLFLGDAAGLYRQAIEGAGAACAGIVLGRPRAGDIAVIAGQRLQAGKADDALALSPLYLREYALPAVREGS